MMCTQQRVYFTDTTFLMFLMFLTIILQYAISQHMEHPHDNTCCNAHYGAYISTHTTHILQMHNSTACYRYTCFSTC